MHFKILLYTIVFQKNFCVSLPTLILCVIFANLIGKINLFFFFASPLLLVTLSIFSYLYWPFNFFCGLPVHILCIFIGLFIFCSLICRCELYILDINPLFYMIIENIFSQSFPVFIITCCLLSIEILKFYVITSVHFFPYFYIFYIF